MEKKMFIIAFTLVLIISFSSCAASDIMDILLGDDNDYVETETDTTQTPEPEDSTENDETQPLPNSPFKNDGTYEGTVASIASSDYGMIDIFIKSTKEPEKNITRTIPMAELEKINTILASATPTEIDFTKAESLTTNVDSEIIISYNATGAFSLFALANFSIKSSGNETVFSYLLNDEFYIYTADASVHRDIYNIVKSFEHKIDSNNIFADAIKLDSSVFEAIGTEKFELTEMYESENIITIWHTDNGAEPNVKQTVYVVLIDKTTGKSLGSKNLGIAYHSSEASTRDGFDVQVYVDNHLYFINSDSIDKTDEYTLPIAENELVQIASPGAPIFGVNYDKDILTYTTKDGLIISNLKGDDKKTLIDADVIQQLGEKSTIINENTIFDINSLHLISPLLMNNSNTIITTLYLFSDPDTSYETLPIGYLVVDSQNGGYEVMLDDIAWFAGFVSKFSDQIYTVIEGDFLLYKHIGYSQTVTIDKAKAFFDSTNLKDFYCFVPTRNEEGVQEVALTKTTSDFNRSNSKNIAFFTGTKELMQGSSPFVSENYALVGYKDYEDHLDYFLIGL